MTKIFTYIHNDDCCESLVKDFVPNNSIGNSGGGAGCIVISSSVGVNDGNLIPARTLPN